MQINDHKFLPAKFLTDRSTTVEEAEHTHLIQTAIDPEPVAFGYLHDEWNKIKRKMREGDHLRYFRTPACTGLALIQGNRIVDFLVCNFSDDHGAQ